MGSKGSSGSVLKPPEPQLPNTRVIPFKSVPLQKLYNDLYKNGFNGARAVRTHKFTDMFKEGRKGRAAQRQQALKRAAHDKALRIKANSEMARPSTGFRRFHPPQVSGW